MDIFKTEEVLVGPNDSKSYRTIFFDVDDICTRLEVSYSVNNSSVIDLGLERDGVSVGWSGSERPQVFIEEDAATPGYFPGIGPGRWGVVLGLHTCKEDTEISVKIRQIKKDRRWYKGDLHSHSHHSDGRHSLENLFRFASMHHFDFISITDHNTAAQNLFRYENNGILFIPGMELTSYWGHMNYWGVPRPVKDHKVLSKKDLYANIAEARANGATVSLNHPFKGPSIWEYGYDVYFDSFEVWNGPWSEKNAQAVQLWHSMLLEGKKVAAVGGSDSHGSKLAHSINFETSNQIPTTWVNSECRSVKAILGNIKQGHVFITYIPDCPRINMTDESNNNLMGESVSPDCAVKIRIGDLRESDIVKLISDKDVIEEHTGSLSYEKDFRMDNALFVRVEVYRKTKIILEEHPNLVIRGRENVAGDPEKYQMASLGNPVYVERKL